MIGESFVDRNDYDLLRASHDRLLATAKDAEKWISEGAEHTINPNVKGIRTLGKGVKLVDRLRAAIAAAEELGP